MREIIFATTNRDKIKEISEMLGSSASKVKTMREIGFQEEIDENGTTFRENSAIKARAVYAYIKRSRTEYKNAIVMADDSGLEIDYYDKKPGVYSHRWLGNRTYPQAMADIIEDMKDVPEEKRTTRFVCSMTAVIPMLDGSCREIVVEETCEGYVAHEMRGENGFGYDPFFYMKEYGCTTAEMTPQQKNEVSHRGKALRSILDKIKPYLQ